jgi:hypothetical protein
MSDGAAGTPLIASWDERLLIAGRAHYLYSERLRRQSLVLDAAVATLALIAATVAFSTPWDAFTDSLVVGSLSVSAAAFAIFASLARFGERRQSHQTCGAKYFALRREIDIISHYHPVDAEERLRHVLATYNQVSDFCPLPSQRVYQRVRREVKGLPRWPWLRRHGRSEDMGGHDGMDGDIDTVGADSG